MERKNNTVILALAAALSGCAAQSGIVSTGPDSYISSRQAATGFTGLGTLKADLLREANAHCASQNKQMQVIDTSESQGPYLFGNYPRAEVQFRCAPPQR